MLTSTKVYYLEGYKAVADLKSDVEQCAPVGGGFCRGNGVFLAKDGTTAVQSQVWIVGTSTFIFKTWSQPVCCSCRNF